MDYTLHEWVRMASHHGSIARCAIEKQAEESGLDALAVREKMRHHLRVMQEAAQQGLDERLRSVTGLTGGQAALMMKRLQGGNVWRRLISDYYPSLRRTDIHVLYSTVRPIGPVECELPEVTLEVPYSVNIAPPTVLPEVEFPEPEPPKERFYTVAAKTNLLYDAVTALNAEVEFPVGKNFSVMVEDVFPWWNWGPNGKKYCFQIWSMGIEPRWWFARDDRRDYLTGHFAGVYGMSGKYDLQWDTKLCYQGEFWSAGLTYGYALPVSRWMNMEFSVSAGFLRTDYRHYQPDPGYEHLFRDKYNVGTVSWFGPTKLKVSLVIPIGKDSHKVNKNKSST